MDTHILWVQHAVCSQRIELKKVLGQEKLADVITKHSISKERLEKLTELYDCQFREGRAQSGPTMGTGSSGKKTIAEADAKARQGHRRHRRRRRWTRAVHTLQRLHEEGAGYTQDCRCWKADSNDE